MTRNSGSDDLPSKCLSVQQKPPSICVSTAGAQPDQPVTLAEKARAQRIREQDLKKRPVAQEEMSG